MGPGELFPPEGWASGPPRGEVLREVLMCWGRGAAAEAGPQ